MSFEYDDEEDIIDETDEEEYPDDENFNEEDVDIDNEEKAFAGNFKENGIEWLNGQKKICFSFSQQRFINKVKKLAEKYPDEVDIVAENLDGSVTGHLPLSYVRISPPRKMSEEQRKAAGERIKAFHKKKKK